MATIVGGKVKKFSWTYEGRRREAWGFTVQVDGRQVRKQGWNSKAEAQDALDAFREEQKNPAPEPPAVVTFKQAVERYEQAKARKRSLAHDKPYLRQLQAVFGADTPLTELTAGRISEWQDRSSRPSAPARAGRTLRRR